MRLILAAFVIFIGANIGINAINYVSNIQDAKLQRLCKIDPTISTDCPTLSQRGCCDFFTSSSSRQEIGIDSRGSTIINYSNEIASRKWMCVLPTSPRL